MKHKNYCIEKDCPMFDLIYFEGAPLMIPKFRCPRHKLKCCFCDKTIEDHGNNPSPVMDNKLKCCDFCNRAVVIPARMENKEWKE